MQTMDEILITNIQHFSLHDGPGIRTTVFLKGCSLRCPWCSNPENIEPYPQKFIKDGRTGVFGFSLSPDSLYREVIKDRIFFEKGLEQKYWTISDASKIDSLPGGVTISGGEPLLQINALLPFLESLRKEKIHVAAETSLFITNQQLQSALSSIDFFFVDLKILINEKCKETEQGELSDFLSNLDTLLRWRSEEKVRKPTVIRIPVIGGYTDNDENRAEIKKVLKYYTNEGNGPLKIELIKGHHLGANKYRSLGIQPKDFFEPTDEFMELYKDDLSSLQIPIEICSI